MRNTNGHKTHYKGVNSTETAGKEYVLNNRQLKKLVFH